MASPIISIHCGQAGCQLAQQYWSQVLQEHQVDEAGQYHGTRDHELERIAVNFHETEGKRYVPRAIHVGLEPGTINSAKASALGQLSKPDAFVSGFAGTGCNYASGFYSEGAEVIDQVMELLRKEAESCDLLQGFQLLHSLAGGTGSGLGALILNKLREEYPDRILATFSIMPAPNYANFIFVEPYSTTFGLHQLINTADLTFAYDNTALYKISMNQLKNTKPSFADLNKLIGQAMCGTTSSLRFPGQSNGDLKRMAMNLVPSPRLHFLSTAFAPFSSEEDNAPKSALDLATQLFESSNQMTVTNSRHGKYLTGSAVFRGQDVTASEVEEAMLKKNPSRSSEFSTSKVPDPTFQLSAIRISNNTGYKELLSQIVEQFSAMYRRRAFIHWYLGEGMDELEFSEAKANVEDLIAEYDFHENFEANEAD